MASEIKESESPPSQSQRADPQQSQSAAKLNKVYVFFWHPYSSVMYSLYEIEVPKHLPPPPDKATQANEIENPKELLPVLQLKTGQYPDGMSCVSLGSKLYFVGGEFNMDNPYIHEDVKKNPKYSERDVFPRQLRILDLSEVGASGYKLHKLRDDDKQMRSGKARPHAFVAEEKIYVIGSTIESSISHRSKLTGLKLESFKCFEVYDPEVGQWHDLPNPPIGKVRTRWVGHAIVRRKALLVAWQGGKERLYCFDLGESRWTDACIPFYPENFSGRTEFVEDTLYGCYHNTIAAIAPVEKKKIEKEEKKEKVEAEEGEKIEEKKVKAEEGEKMKEKEVKTEEGEKMEEKKVEAEEEEEEAKEFGQGWLLKNLHLHVLSEEMGMDAIFNVHPQLQSSSSLLHLGNRYFCYVKSGMPPNSDNDNDDVIKDDKKRFISIVIFQALGKKYEKVGTGLLQAQFLYSAHYEINSPVPNEGFIDGCFFPGSVNLKKSMNKKELNLPSRSSKRVSGFELEIMASSISSEQALQNTSRETCESEATVPLVLADGASQQLEAGFHMEFAHHASTIIDTPLLGDSSNKSEKPPAVEVQVVPEEQLQLPETEIMPEPRNLPFPLSDSWSDPCLEFAIKTLTGALPVEDNLAQGYYQSSSESVMISSKSRREVKNTEDQNTEHRDADSVTEHKRQVNVREK